MRTNPMARGADDQLVNLALIVVVAAFVLAVMLRAAGSVAAVLAGTARPAGGPASGFRVIANPSDPAQALSAPGLPAAVYWLVVAVMFGLFSAMAWVVWMTIAGARHRSDRDP